MSHERRQFQQRKLRAAARACWVGFAASLALAACSSASDRATAAGARGQQYFEARNYLSAVRELDYAVRQKDDDIELWLLLGRAQLALRAYPAAYAAYARVVELDQANIEGLSQLAELRLANQDYDAAAKTSEQLLALDGNDVHAMLVKGYALLGRSRYKEADGVARQILALAPDNETGRVLRARVLVQEGQAGPALELLAPFLAKETPSIAVVQAGRAAFRDLGDSHGLERTARLLAADDPTDRTRQLTYARELYLNNKGDQALAVIDKLVALYTSDTTLLTRIVQLWQDMGLTYSEIARARRNAVCADDLCSLLAADEASTAPLRQLVAARAARSVDDPTYTAIGALLFAAMGEMGAAQKEAERARRLDPDNPLALLATGRVALGRGNSGAAVSAGRIMLRDDPSFVPAIALLATAFEKRNDTVLLREAVSEGLTAAPSNATVLKVYNRTMLALGSTALALRASTRFVARNPESALGWRVHLDTCQQLGEPCVRDAQANLALLARAQTRPRPPKGSAVLQLDVGEL